VLCRSQKSEVCTTSLRFRLVRDRSRADLSTPVDRASGMASLCNAHGSRAHVSRRATGRTIFACLESQNRVVLPRLEVSRELLTKLQRLTTTPPPPTTTRIAATTKSKYYRLHTKSTILAWCCSASLLDEVRDSKWRWFLTVLTTSCSVLLSQTNHSTNTVHHATSTIRHQGATHHIVMCNLIHPPDTIASHVVSKHCNCFRFLLSPTVTIYRHHFPLDAY
jgi:hypothetical protein